MSLPSLYPQVGYSSLLCFSILLSGMITPLKAQEAMIDPWTIGWTIVGDSTANIDRDSKLVITGRVTDEESGQPVVGALVSADFLKYYDHSDANGNYVLEMPPGEYRLKVTRVGMIPAYLRLRVLSNGLVNVTMREGIVQLTEVVVTARPLDSNVKESLGGITRMTVAEIKTLPTLAGEIDVIKSLQLMPGVSSVGEGSSGINVRGGRVDQNLVLLNGAPIFNTSHALGFLSAFNQDVIDGFTLYKGNVPANLGGRASSVIEITTRRGDFQEWNTHVGAGPLSSRMTIEGPLVKDRTSLLAAGRVSHANWVLGRVDDPDVRKSRVAFNDAFLGLAHRFNASSSADITFHTTHDNFRLADQFGFSWSNQLLNAQWQMRADKKLSPVLSATWGRFANDLYDPSGVDASEVSNVTNYFHLKQNVNYIPSDNHDVNAGVSALAYVPRDETRRGYRGNDAIPNRKSGKPNGIELAVFANDDFRINRKFSVSAGLRLSMYYHVGPDTVFRYIPDGPQTKSTITDTTFYGSGSRISTFTGIEPRISARIALAEDQSVKVSYNRMYQYVHLISNTTTPTPIDLWHVATEYLPAQWTDNFSIGYFRNLKENQWETSAEVFYKDMHNLVEYKDFARLLLNDHLETDLLSAQGRAWGTELFFRKLKGKWTGWLSYTYSVTEVMAPSIHEGESINRGEWFPGNYNKPHNLNLVVNRYLYRKGALSFIISYSSGRPFTAIESSYLADETVVPVFSDRNKYRIPDYFRADVSITMGSILRKYDDSLVFSVYNIFGRENAYSLFYQRPAINYFVPKPYKLSVLGVAFPSLSYNLKF